MSRLFSLALLASSVVAQAPTVTTVYSSGSTQSRYDIVILGDGYQIQEQPRFNQDVQTLLTSLFQKQPYATFANYYNVHTVFRASVDSGADQPDVTPPIYKNTVYDATYNTGGTARCLYIQNTAQALADAALAPANEGRVLVMVNDSRYGGCASTFAVSYNGSSMAEVQIHEMGHSLGGLADEYDYPNQTYSGGEPSSPNITTSPTGQKWAHWHGTEGVSAFQGAGYYLYGLYRPKNNCLMRTLGVILCPVCREQISIRTNAVVNTIATFSPNTTNVSVSTPNQQIFSITHFVPATNNPVISWEVDGVPVTGANGPAFLLDSSTMSLGPHTVAVNVQDQTTQVRNDPAHAMRETQTWQVSINDPTAAQLRIPSFSMSQVWAQPGQSITLNAQIVNDGPAAAGPFAVEYFATTNQNWTPQSLYLGADQINGLAATQQLNLQRTVQLPWSLEPRVYYVYAVVDRADAVYETNENDNQRLSAFVGQTGPCGTHLEFVDPLTCPYDANSVPVATGGVVHPTVVAPCAVGSYYLVVWGCSGTTPGTPIAPGLTVPLNRDFCTDLGLIGLNGTWFANFFGVIDAQGLGRATFSLPANTGLQATPGHFAAMLMDAGGFSAVTNPVAITLQ
ncbi:MAG: hypothetical protein H6838_00705 [Planctomycetes bacterium]|nr:hypothetical protein [Planctomycetota bacterium]MCB9883974.1 hypothetical protein [Planctomycetota bacterium]